MKFETSEVIQPLSLSYSMKRMLAMIYLVTLHYDGNAWVNRVKQELSEGEDISNNRRVIMLISRLKRKLKEDLCVELSVKNARIRSVWGDRYYEVTNWGLLNKSTILALLKLHRDYFRNNFAKIINSEKNV